MTHAPEALFNPDFSKVQVKPVLDIALPLLAEILHYGLALFARCSVRPEGDDENLAILFPYRHFLELLDSVVVQIAECAPAPSALQLRGMFEAMLTIGYITRDKPKVRQRAFAYLHQVELQRSRFYQIHDPDTDVGKEMRKYVAGDPSFKEFTPTDIERCRDRVKGIDEMLARPDFMEIIEEYKRTKRELHGRRPAWHALFNGPSDIRALAKDVGFAASYEILYKEWSERGHSVDAIDRILSHGPEGSSA